MAWVNKYVPAQRDESCAAPPIVHQLLNSTRYEITNYEKPAGAPARKRRRACGKIQKPAEYRLSANRAVQVEDVRV